MTQPEAEEAIALVQGGTLDAYRTVLTVYHRSLRNFIAGLCPPGIDCDEIAHLTFVKAYQSIGTYRKNTNFFAWLTAIARNILRCELEKNQRRTRNEQNYLEHLLIQEMSRLCSQEPTVEACWSDFLNDCLAQLKDEARALISLRYSEGVRVQDIAFHQGRSADSVSVQLFRLREMLRDCVMHKAATAVPAEGD